MKLLRRNRGRASGATREVALEWTRTLWKDKLWRGTTWLGVPILQWPTDLHILQELLFEARPKVIVETGTNAGGSALFFASMLGLIHDDPTAGRVVTVDIRIPDDVRKTLSDHPVARGRITAIEGDSKSTETMARVEEAIGDERDLFVFLDSDHSRDHVLAELRAYEKLVPPNGWLIAFDTICRDLHDLPGAPSEWKDDNPLAAVDRFLEENRDFERTREPEKLGVTFGPGGFLRRRSGGSER